MLSQESVYKTIPRHGHPSRHKPSVLDSQPNAPPVFAFAVTPLARKFTT